MSHDRVFTMLDFSSKTDVGKKWRLHAMSAAAVVVLTLGCSAARAGLPDVVSTHPSVDRSGDLRVTEGMTLRLIADIGNVRVQTLPAGAPPVLHYTVHVETDAAGETGKKLLDAYSLVTRETVDSVSVTGAVPNLSRGANARGREQNPQFYVQFVVTVPMSFSLDISTGLGDIETPDIGGRVTLATQGGNITAGRIGMAGPAPPHGERSVAKIETQGGHITLKDVAGDLDAYTAGGHIVVGNVEGNAKLWTGGGHIRATSIKGTAKLETEGGNITVGEAGSYVAVKTAGGQIDFGEVHGSVRAETGGGGIRVISVAGPMEVASSGGSICLTRVANRVHAETGDGTITAWINPEIAGNGQLVHLPGPSQLASRSGDIVVFLPRNIAMTIDATVENGGPNRILADPSLPLNVQAQGNGLVHGVAALNGGGALLKLHTMGGKIHLQYLETQTALRRSLQEEERQRLAERLNEYQATQVSLTTPGLEAGNTPPELSADSAKDDWYDSAKKRFEVIFMGSLHEDSREFTKRLTVAPAPEYPALARNAGIQGRVVLQIRLKTDGTAVVDKVLEGEPVLVDATIATIQKWRGRPGEVNGKAVDVVSTVSFDYQLR